MVKKNAQIIILSLVCIIAFAFVEDIAVFYVFNTLANISADYRHTYEDVVNEQIERSKPPSMPESSSTITYNPDGTKTVSINLVVSIHFEIGMSTEFFDYSAYLQHIMTWAILENIFKLVRDVHGWISTFTAVVLLMILSSSQLKRLPRWVPRLKPPYP